jgi:hypothetical protein
MDALACDWCLIRVLWFDNAAASVEPPRPSPTSRANTDLPPPPPPNSFGGRGSSVEMAVMFFTVAAGMVAAVAWSWDVEPAHDALRSHMKIKLIMWSMLPVMAKLFYLQNSRPKFCLMHASPFHISYRKFGCIYHTQWRPNIYQPCISKIWLEHNQGIFLILVQLFWESCLYFYASLVSAHSTRLYLCSRYTIFTLVCIKWENYKK